MGTRKDIPGIGGGCYEDMGYHTQRPVSYTHLDVYKRQQMVFLIEHHSQGMGSIEDQGAVGGGDQVGATKVVFHQGGPIQGGKLRHGQKGIPLLHRE